MLCIGQKGVDQKELQYLRKICWTVYAGYADPKSRPANETYWWPLDTDPPIKTMSRAKQRTIDKKFRSLKWNRD